MPGQSCMPVTADDPGALIPEAEAVIREAAARTRRKELQEERNRRRAQARQRKAAEQAECGRERCAEEERLRAGAEEARAVLLRKARMLRDAAGGSIRDCFEGLPEPRDPRGLRYPLPAVLTLVVLAMLHGKTKLAAITAWIAHAGQEMLELAGCRHRRRDGRLAAPSPKTVTRLLGLTGAKALAGAVNRYLAAGIAAEAPAYPVSGPALQPQVACDGKMIRGALRGDGTPLFLLSAAAAGPVNAPGGAVVIADREISAKTNEIPEIAPMLRELNEYFPLAGQIMTADALHTQDGFTVLARQELGAHFVLTVKKNRKNLCAALDELCWAGAARHVTTDKGPRPRRDPQPPRHGRPAGDQGTDPARGAGRQGPPRPHRPLPERRRQHLETRHEDDPRDRIPGHQPDRPRGRAGTHRRLYQVALGHRERGSLGARRYPA